MPIRYRSNSTSPWIYINGDSFTTELTQKECWGSNIRPVVACDVEIWSNFTGAVWFNSFNGSGSPISNLGQVGYRFQGIRISATKKIIHFDYLTSTGSTVTHDYIYSGPLYVKRAEVRGVGYQYRYINPATGSVSYEPIDPLTFNSSQNAVNGNICTNQGCTLRVFEQGQLVHSQTFTTCPEAEIVTNQCPPNTCDVLCGNTICCYGADGVSVFNYPNI
jgi:hypothetical protein